MQELRRKSPIPLGILVYLGMTVLGYIIGLTPISRFLYVFSFLLCLPITYLGFLYGERVVIFFGFALLVTYSIMIPSVIDKIMAIFLFIVVPAILGVGLKKKLKFREILISMTFLFFLGGMISVYYIQEVKEISIVQYLEQVFQSAIAQLELQAEQLGKQKLAIMDVSNQLKEIQTSLIESLPSTILFFAALQSFIYFIVGRFFIWMMGKYSNIKAFYITRIDIGKGYSWAFLVTFFMQYLIGDYPSNKFYFIVLSNVLSILFYLFLVQGMSVNLFFLKNKTSWNKKVMAVSTIFLFLVLPQYGLLLLLTIGLFDLMFNFRNLNRSTSI